MDAANPRATGGARVLVRDVAAAQMRFASEQVGGRLREVVNRVEVTARVNRD